MCWSRATGGKGMVRGGVFNVAEVLSGAVGGRSVDRLKGDCTLQTRQLEGK